MRSILAAVAAVLLLTTSSAAAPVQVIIGDAGPGTSALGSGIAPTDQTFIVPAGVNRITAASIAVGDAGPFTISLHRRDGGVVGPALASASFTSSPQFAPNNAAVGPDIPPSGIVVTPGDEYVIRSTSEYTALAFNYYDDGSVVTPDGPNPFYDAYFTVTFDDQAPAQVPTMTEWAMILFGLALASGAALLIHRRRLTV